MRVLPFTLALVLLACGDADPKTTSNSNANANPNNVENTNNTGTNNTNTLRVNMENFDQTCDFDSDCELVLPNVCGCDCNYAGINADDLDEYSSVSDAIECPPGDACGPCLPNVVPACHQGQCISREPFEIRAENYEVSCEQNSDCMVIHSGDICESCVCGGIAVNVDSYNANPAPEAQCTPAPSPCACVKYETARCDNNICVVES